MDIYWMNLICLFALLAMQQIIRRLPERIALAEEIHGAIVFITGVSLWRFVSCWAETFTGGFFLSMTLGRFSLLVFAGGEGFLVDPPLLRGPAGGAGGAGGGGRWGGGG